MQGFDSKFKDFPDYILGITHEIWEQRGVDTLNHYYAPEIIVRSPTSVVVGNQTVIDATNATLEEFPDRQLLGEDVIWCGTPEDGLLSSHRILSTATHSNDGVYGKATGTKLSYRVIADCHAKNNTIDDEWLIRDQAAIVRQLGIDPKDYARTQIETEGANSVLPFPANDISGPYQGKGNDNRWGQQLADILKRISSGDHQVFSSDYDRAAHLEYPGFRTQHGAEAAHAFWASITGSLSPLKFEVHHQIGREDPTLPARAAVRWSITGTHSQAGVFGKPTGAEVYIMGITHAEFGSFGAAPVTLRREYTLFDETAIWKQILLHTG